MMRLYGGAGPTPKMVQKQLRTAKKEDCLGLNYGEWMRSGEVPACGQRLVGLPFPFKPKEGALGLLPRAFHQLPGCGSERGKGEGGTGKHLDIKYPVQP